MINQDLFIGKDHIVIRWCASTPVSHTFAALATSAGRQRKSRERSGVYASLVEVG